MLQLVVWIMCFYLLVKGVELIQIARASDKPIMGLSMTAAIVCAVMAVVFVMMSVAIGESMPSAPRF